MHVLLVRYKNTTFIYRPLLLSLVNSIGSSRQANDVPGEVQSGRLRSWHRTLPSAGYQRDTPLAVNRWHGSPVGLSSTCWVLDRAAPFARRCRRSDDDFPFSKVSTDSRARLVVDDFRRSSVSFSSRDSGTSGTGRGNRKEASPSTWRNTTLRTGRRRRGGKEGRKAGKANRSVALSADSWTAVTGLYANNSRGLLLAVGGPHRFLRRNFSPRVNFPRNPNQVRISKREIRNFSSCTRAFLQETGEVDGCLMIRSQSQYNNLFIGALEKRVASGLREIRSNWYFKWTLFCDKFEFEGDSIYRRWDAMFVYTNNVIWKNVLSLNDKFPNGSLYNGMQLKRMIECDLIITVKYFNNFNYSLTRCVCNLN